MATLNTSRLAWAKICANSQRRAFFGPNLCNFNISKMPNRTFIHAHRTLAPQQFTELRISTGTSVLSSKNTSRSFHEFKRNWICICSQVSGGSMSTRTLNPAAVLEQNLFKRWFPMQSFCTSSTSFTTRNRRKKGIDQLPFEIDTNVPEDVLVYGNEGQERFFFMVSLFGIAQFGFWMYLAAFSYYNLRDVKEKESEDCEDNETLPFWRRINLGSNKYRYGVSTLCATLGYVLIFISMTYPMRAVKFLRLLKGGRQAEFTTYGPFGHSRSFRTPVEHITSMQSRVEMKTQLSMKVKNRYLFYLLDSTGKFYNTKLFDYMVGLKRQW